MAVHNSDLALAPFPRPPQRSTVLESGLLFLCPPDTCAAVDMSLSSITQHTCIANEDMRTCCTSQGAGYLVPGTCFARWYSLQDPRVSRQAPASLACKVYSIRAGSSLWIFSLERVLLYYIRTYSNFVVRRIPVYEIQSSTVAW